MASPRLNWLRIHRYRNVVPGTFLEFNDGFNVLLGRNGTGKTTLLELLEMLWTRGFGRIADEAFHLECEAEFEAFRHDPIELVDTTIDAKETPGFRVRATLENVLPARTGGTDERHTGATAGEFRYRVALVDLDGVEAMAVEGSPIGARLRVVGASEWPVAVLDVHSFPVLWSAPRQLFHSNSLDDAEDDRPIASPVRDWAESCSLMVEVGPLDAVRFDESLTAFHALTDIHFKSQDRGVEGVRWELERRLDVETKVYPLQEQTFLFTPRALAYHCQMELRGDVRREPPEFRVPHTALPLLARFVEMTAYSGARVDVRPFDRKRARAVERLLFRTPEFYFALPDDRGEIREHALSYGEKRLLSFLWYLACGPSTVIADELVNGFHHEWIERCVELIGDRQSFLASQNPLLLDALPFPDEEYVRRCFITCRRGPETGGQMQWANLSAEEAADFYAAYKRATRYVHEILRGKGLW